MSEDLTLLIKMLKMTTSDNDNTALVAIRKANQHLAKVADGDWEKLLKGKVTIIADPFASAPPPSNADIRNTAHPTPPPQPRPRTPPPPSAGSRPFRHAPGPAPRPQPRPAPTPTYQQKASQSAKQRRANPVTLDDLI